MKAHLSAWRLSIFVACFVLLAGCASDTGAPGTRGTSRPGGGDTKAPDGDTKAPDAGGGGGVTPPTSTDGGAPASSLPGDYNRGGNGNAAADKCVSAATASGESKLCASCTCGSCVSAAGTCYASGDQAKDAACTAIVHCALQSGCTGDACYCNGDPIGCLFAPAGPCVAQIDAAIGGHGPLAVLAARGTADPAHPFVRAENLLACSHAQCDVPCAPASTSCSLEDIACQDRICRADAAREQARANSAANSAKPRIDEIYVGGNLIWQKGQTRRPVLTAGQEVVLRGSGFGAGTDVDFSKISIGPSRVLETDLTMYDQKLDVARQVNYELLTDHGKWPRDVVRWSDAEVAFRVPKHASKGPLAIQVQKRLPANESLLRSGEAHFAVDALTARIRDASFAPGCDVVSGLGPSAIDTVDVDVVNPGFADLVARGRAVYWAYDYGVGLAHSARNLDWTTMMEGRATDPVTGLAADPLLLFGAYPTVRGEVPNEAIDDVAFSPYPQPSPIPGFLGIGAQLLAGNTRSSGRVGYRYAQSVNPYRGNGEWIGFNCASCHGYRIEYQSAPGKSVTRVVPGLPNPTWSMKWAVIGGTFTGIKANEPGPRWDPGTQAVDKTALIYAMPQGAGEHNIVRLVGEGSHTDNDYQFSPIAIPSVTHYTKIRRSLGHTESYVGFEGSYIHSEEPDGAMGSMYPEPLQALTAYMTTLDQYDDELRKVGLYRWLKYQGQLAAQVGNVGEGDFVVNGWNAYPNIAPHLARGAQIYAARCGNCHTDGVGTNTTEVMVRLDQVGRFFAPTIYQKEMQSIRATFLRDLYWVQHRGLLTDGHVRNLKDLVDPARCTAGSPLYNQYYTVHPPVDPGPAGPDFPAAYPTTGRRGDVFRVARATSTFPDDDGAKKNRFIERHRYFVTVPWDPNHYYWDYQKMRTEYGPAEMGTARPLGMPAAPHPWCAGAPDEIDDLVEYLLTL